MEYPMQAQCDKRTIRATQVCYLKLASNPLAIIRSTPCTNMVATRTLAWLAIHVSSIISLSRVNACKLAKRGRRRILWVALIASKAGFGGYDGTSFRYPPTNTPELNKMNWNRFSLSMLLPVAVCHHRLSLAEGHWANSLYIMHNVGCQLKRKRTK